MGEVFISRRGGGYSVGDTITAEKLDALFIASKSHNTTGGGLVDVYGGTVLIQGGEDNYVRAYDIETGELLQVFSSGEMPTYGRSNVVGDYYIGPSLGINNRLIKLDLITGVSTYADYGTSDYIIWVATYYNGYYYGCATTGGGGGGILKWTWSGSTLSLSGNAGYSLIFDSGSGGQREYFKVTNGYVIWKDSTEKLNQVPTTMSGVDTYGINIKHFCVIGSYIYCTTANNTLVKLALGSKTPIWEVALNNTYSYYVRAGTDGYIYVINSNNTDFQVYNPDNGALIKSGTGLDNLAIPYNDGFIVCSRYSKIFQTMKFSAIIKS